MKSPKNFSRNFRAQPPVKNPIMYPVAYNFATQEIVEIKDVTNAIKESLGCPICRSRFTAVINHRTPHFRHFGGSRCTGGPETMLHWATKQLFKKIKEIELPELLIDDLPESPRQQFQIAFNNIIDQNVPCSFRIEFKKGLKQNLSESRNLALDTVDLEKEFDTTSGKIRVDIVATVSNRHLFIEPFITNPVDDEKIKKLSLIKAPTLSIDLNPFFNHHGPHYSLHDLRDYLISRHSKKWIYCREAVYSKHIDNYVKYLFEEIERKRSELNFHQTMSDRKLDLEKQRRKLAEKLKHIQNEINNIDNEISAIEEELGGNF